MYTIVKRSYNNYAVISPVGVEFNGFKTLTDAEQFIGHGKRVQLVK